MPDYTSILRRSIAALPDSSPEMRAAVYQRARAALARQLTAVDPPLSTREIEAQHQELEDAVARLEAEHAPEEPPAPADTPAPRLEVAPAAAAPAKSGAYLESPSQPDDVRAAELPAQIDSRDEEDEYDDEERPSRVPLVATLLLLVLVVGGIGAYGYAQRDRVLAMLGLADSTQEMAVNEAPAVPVVTSAPPAPALPAAALAEDTAPDKRLDRLTNGEDPPPVEAAVPAETAALDVPAVAAPPASEVPENESPPSPEAPPAELPGEEQTAALQDPTQSLVAQRAIYYFQGTDNAPGRVAQGSVTWAETTRDGMPAVQATLRLSEQEITTTVTIYKNNDDTLPASHLVEVQFSGNIGPTPIQRVPALVLKQTEQARGQPLTGAAVPVTNELFWIALSDDPDQTAKNLRLLREGSWFDIPILFNDGTRALLTFEKGIPGDKVFETVMSSWTPA